jgi:cysteine desulfurase
MSSEIHKTHTPGLPKVYLDNNSTMQLLPEVLEYMVALMSQPLNPSSLHASGRNAKSYIEQARKDIASLVGVRDVNRGPYNLTFTSSGTEANNLVMHNFKDADIFVSSIEHYSILKFQDYGLNIKLINVKTNGLVDPDHLEWLLSQSMAPKKLVSVMLANNETGIIQPLKEIASVARKYSALVHSDAVQAAGKIPIHLTELDLDFMTLSSHKFGGPIGAGALIYQSKHQLLPLMVGGGQERGVRSGTENVSAIVGFGKAAEIVKARLETNYNHLKSMQKVLEETLLAKNPEIKVIGKELDRLPNTSLIINPGCSSEKQLIALDLQGIEVSSGSACSSGKVSKSHVLEAMNLLESETKSAIRVSTSHFNNMEDINIFLEKFIGI